MNIEAQEGMVYAGIKDSAFARLMSEILQTYTRIRGVEVGRKVKPSFEEETRGIRTVVQTVQSIRQLEKATLS